MKLRVKDRVRLEKVLTSLDKGIYFLMSDRVDVMTKSSSGTHSINKELGSELVYILNAKEQLQKLLLETEKIVSM